MSERITRSKREILHLIQRYQEDHHGKPADMLEIIALTQQTSRSMRRNCSELLTFGYLSEHRPWVFAITDKGRELLGEANG